ncbi:MAG: Flp family type IVb pilin [Terracidiphilus sp.]
MNNLFPIVYLKLQSLMDREEGQDLVEYALLVALIAVVCVTAISGLATSIEAAFTTISGDI